uniref:WD domaincontaining protein putative n=1 Tax=Albugo laibachii Nc14 TaxID=890382 RepID=F0WK95_9STRA|nr:WD domaincontaining protein putative [Albugo laibachii Nc14]|eukprot:CCA21698.1 WD domaincontaining protein putative [Albugo laibachii Nc14]
MDTQNAPQLIEHIQHSIPFTPNDTKWLPSTARFVTLGIHPNASGAISVFELHQGALRTITNLQKPNGLKCGSFGASSLHTHHLATGDYSGVMSVWDLEYPDLPIYSAQAHLTIVNAIDGFGGHHINCGPPEIVTGGRDGCIRVWDTRVPSPVVTLSPEESHLSRDCWTVCFGNACSDTERCVIGGFDNGDLKLFDLRVNKIRWETNCQNGVVSTQFDRNSIEMNKLLVTTLEAKFRVYDMRTQHIEKGFACLVEKAHKSTVWQGKFMPQNREIFITAGGNGGINIYK